MAARLQSERLSCSAKAIISARRSPRIRPLEVRPLVVLLENYLVTRGHIREIYGVQDDARTVGDGEALPIREPDGQKEDAFFHPVRNPVHSLSVNLAISFPNFFVLLLNSSVEPPVLCCADRFYRNCVNHHSFRLFLAHGSIPRSNSKTASPGC
jgi:hypothetical protein